MISLTNSQIGELMGQFLLAGTGTLSFAILFACPRRSLPTCALVGAMGWFVYELCVMLGLDTAAASLLAVIPLTILTRVFQHGISKVEELAYTVPIEDSIQIQTRSIMGTEIPHVKYDAHENQLTYAMDGTFESIDVAREAFRQVKDLTIKLSMVENAAYRLATSIKKTQKRANALKNITIPTYTGLVYKISNELEEKEREEFTRLKVIKRMKQKG